MKLKVALQVGIALLFFMSIKGKTENTGNTLTALSADSAHTYRINTLQPLIFRSVQLGEASCV